jgi:hypothetical protein
LPFSTRFLHPFRTNPVLLSAISHRSSAAWLQAPTHSSAREGGVEQQGKLIGPLWVSTSFRARSSHFRFSANSRRRFSARKSTVNAEGVGEIPRLGGLAYTYLKLRLQQWGEGYHGALELPMPHIASKLSRDQIEELASYLSFVK